MDSSADPHAFEDKKADAASGDGADAGAGPKGEASQELTVPDTKASAGPERKEPAPPKVEPIPSSALVVLPPQREKFDNAFAAGERLGGSTRARRSSFASYGLRAAAVLLVAGGAYALGSRYLAVPGFGMPGAASPGIRAAAISSSSGSFSPTVAKAGSVARVASAAPAGDLAELRSSAKTLSDEVQKLQTRLAALQAQTPDEIRGLKKSLDGLRADLDAERADSKAQIAALSAKLDHLHEAAPRVSTSEKARTRLDAKAIQATLDRAARNEGPNGDVTGTVSASATAAHATSMTMASAEAPRHTPQLLNDWIVRDVYRGIALVEGPQGAMEVMPGDILPGAGTVRAIERRGEGWIVLTSRGYVDYDHD